MTIAHEVHERGPRPATRAPDQPLTLAEEHGLLLRQVAVTRCCT
jgi:hypothetical protein